MGSTCIQVIMWWKILSFWFSLSYIQVSICSITNQLSSTSYNFNSYNNSYKLNLSLLLNLLKTLLLQKLYLLFLFHILEETLGNLTAFVDIDMNVAIALWTTSFCAEKRTCVITFTFYGQDDVIVHAEDVSCDAGSDTVEFPSAFVVEKVNTTIAIPGSSQPPLQTAVESKYNMCTVHVWTVLYYLVMMYHNVVLVNIIIIYCNLYTYIYLWFRSVHPPVPLGVWSIKNCSNHSKVWLFLFTTLPKGIVYAHFTTAFWTALRRFEYIIGYGHFHHTSFWYHAYAHFTNALRCIARGVRGMNEPTQWKG